MIVCGWEKMFFPVTLMIVVFKVTLQLKQLIVENIIPWLNNGDLSVVGLESTTLIALWWFKFWYGHAKVSGNEILLWSAILRCGRNSTCWMKRLDEEDIKPYQFCSVCSYSYSVLSLWAHELEVHGFMGSAHVSQVICTRFWLGYTRIELMNTR